MFVRTQTLAEKAQTLADLLALYLSLDYYNPKRMNLSSTKKLLLIICLLIPLFSNGQNSWIQKSNYGGYPVNSASGFSIGSKGYLGTGFNAFGNLTNEFWEYDPATDSWTQKANFGGVARRGAVGFSIGGKGYMGTGDITVTTSNTLGDFWEYDPLLNSWTQINSFFGAARTYAVGFSIGNKGYIGTGGNNSGYLNDFWEYDPATNSWVQKANFGGIIRWQAVGYNIGNKGYIGTGGDGFNSMSDFWEYNPSTNSWVQKANFAGGGRPAAVGFNIGNKGYLGTGNGSGLNHFNDFWEYDPVNDNWTQMMNLTGVSRYAAVGLNIGNKGYIGTGFHYGLANIGDFWEYTPECNAYFTVYPDTIVPHLWYAINHGWSVNPISYSWNWGDGTPNDTGAYPSHTYNSPGYYNICLTITDSGGCTNTYCDSSNYLYRSTSNNSIVTINVSSQIPTGLSTKNSFVNSFIISPNPTNSTFTITTNTPLTNPQIKIYNTLGENIYTEEIKTSATNFTKQISLNAPSGIYFVKVGDGEHEFTKKLVVE